MKVIQTSTFKRTIKKLHENEKKALDDAIKKVIKYPEMGVKKKGDLLGVSVYKFKVKTQEYLLAYSYTESPLVVILLACGTHENFYKKIKG